jgi:hypothetical protein
MKKETTPKNGKGAHKKRLLMKKEATQKHAKGVIKKDHR